MPEMEMGRKRMLLPASAVYAVERGEHIMHYRDISAFSRTIPCCACAGTEQPRLPVTTAGTESMWVIDDK